MADCLLCREKDRELARLHEIIDKLIDKRSSASAPDPFSTGIPVLESMADEQDEVTPEPIAIQNQLWSEFSKVHEVDPYGGCRIVTEKSSGD